MLREIQLSVTGNTLLRKRHTCNMNVTDNSITGMFTIVATNQGWTQLHL